ncbi:hypothetical protein C0431_05550 [bacterium]|nr:hypothetical protein [bacterium]
MGRVARRVGRGCYLINSLPKFGEGGPIGREGLESKKFPPQVWGGWPEGSGGVGVQEIPSPILGRACPWPEQGQAQRVGRGW